jgi:hypothetical protein
MIPRHALDDICQVDDTCRVGWAINFQVYCNARIGIFGHLCFCWEKNVSYRLYDLMISYYGLVVAGLGTFLIYPCDRTSSALTLGEMDA